jgi:hypothetical protein
VGDAVGTGDPGEPEFRGERGRIPDALQHRDRRAVPGDDDSRCGGAHGSEKLDRVGGRLDENGLSARQEFDPRQDRLQRLSQPGEIRHALGERRDRREARRAELGIAVDGETGGIRSTLTEVTRHGREESAEGILGPATA